MRIITLDTNREHYDIREAADASMTVGELIEELRYLDPALKVVFSNDGGYTYGGIHARDIDSEYVETVEEEQAREEQEEREAELEELGEELTDLQARYENPGDYIDEDEHPMTDEEYRAERQALFADYGITEEEYEEYRRKKA